MMIKETAGKIILLLYSLQSTNPAKLENSSITFIMSNKVKLETDNWLKRALHEVTEDNAMLYNAFNYLLDKTLVSKRNSKGIMGGVLLIGPHLTACGIDIIEGIEQGVDQQKVIKSLFNFSFKLSPTMKIDSLIKAEVGNIVGVGGAVSGKVSL